MAAVVDPGWGDGTDPNRPTNVVDGCLNALTISGEVSFPSKAVLLCGVRLCPARSDHVGQLPCRGIPT